MNFNCLIFHEFNDAYMHVKISIVLLSSVLFLFPTLNSRNCNDFFTITCAIHNCSKWYYNTMLHLLVSYPQEIARNCLSIQVVHGLPSLMVAILSVRPLCEYSSKKSHVSEAEVACNNWLQEAPDNRYPWSGRKEEWQGIQHGWWCITVIISKTGMRTKTKSWLNT